MRKETNDAVNAVITDLSDLQYESKMPAISVHAAMLVSVISNAESDLHDCVNELCLKCGNYHESYAGTCDGCRWKAVKEGFR